MILEPTPDNLDEHRRVREASIAFITAAHDGDPEAMRVVTDNLDVDASAVMGDIIGMLLAVLDAAERTLDLTINEILQALVIE